MDLNNLSNQDIERFKKLYKGFEEVVNSSNQDLIQENANTDGKSPMGMMGIFASLGSKLYGEKLLEPSILKAFNDGYIHIHDYDMYTTGTTTCVQLPLAKILKDGFTVGGCYMREPKDIMTAGALSSIAIQSNQNNQHGGQSYASFDYDLAPYVEKTYHRQLAHLKKLVPQALECQLEKIALEETIEMAYQSMEAFIHNANSMLCRNGMQVPFVSLNLGTDTSVWGRIVSEQLMKAVQRGLGDGSTPIFPIIIFKIKDGINFKESDPNYDLYQLALETTSKRLFPNFAFIDAPFNLEHYKENNPSSEVAYMGCRTRVLADINGDATTIGRGNLSFTTLNLPLIAYESKDLEDFYNSLDNYMDLICKQLYQRYLYQKSRQAGNFAFLYGQGVWKNGEYLDPNKPIGDALDTGTLSMGFVGLAECLVALLGEHHGDSKNAQHLGLEIVSYMKKRLDLETQKTHLNYTLLGTPAESYCGKALRKFKSKHGEITGISDREYFTNSFHIPVYYDITAFEKIEIESPYHELTNAGHITYVELDGVASKNVKALDQIVHKMYECGIGYGSINHPVDDCLACNYHGVINNECPICGEKEEISRIRRITGYLVGDMKRWNSAKLSEEKDRVKHLRGRV